MESIEIFKHLQGNAERPETELFNITKISNQLKLNSV